MRGTDRRGVSLAGLLAGCLGLSGCLSGGPLGNFADAGGEAGWPLGRFSVVLPSALAGGEAWKVAEGSPDLCTSGEHQLFFGADFPDRRHGAVLRLAVDPIDGAAVRVFDPQDPEILTVVFRPGDCSTFRYSLEPSGWRINDFRDFRVALEVDCDTGDGTTLRAQVSAAHCS